MSWTFWSIVVLGGIIAWWYSERSAHEIARHAVEMACRRAAVQWLDQAVVLQSRRWVHRQLVRRYGFEYAANGERHLGQLEVVAGRVTWLVLGEIIDSVVAEDESI